MLFELEETATNLPRPYVNAFHNPVAGNVAKVQFIPLSLYATLFEL